MFIWSAFSPLRNAALSCVSDLKASRVVLSSCVIRSSHCLDNASTCFSCRSVSSRISVECACRRLSMLRWLLSLRPFMYSRNASLFLPPLRPFNANAATAAMATRVTTDSIAVKMSIF